MADGSSNADAVVEQQGGILLFVEPYEVSEPFDIFLDYVQHESNANGNSDEGNVKYAQTRE